MTGEAVFIGCAGIVEDPSLLVRLVAIHACRDLVRLFLPEAALDDLHVDFFDAGVTLGTRGGHVVVMDAGPRVGVRQNIVGGVTGRADRRDAQAGSEEAVSMDGHGVVLENTLLGNVVGPGDRAPLPVTFSAQERDVHGGGG
jgi:hypothetical protein